MTHATPPLSLQSKEKLQQWRSRGRAEWMATSLAVLREAGIEHA